MLRALRHGGLHFASYKGGGIEARDTFGRYFNYLSRDDAIAAYERSGPWEILSVIEYQGGGYDKKQGPWLGITARKPA